MHAGQPPWLRRRQRHILARTKRSQAVAVSRRSAPRWSQAGGKKAPHMQAEVARLMAVRKIVAAGTSSGCGVKPVT